MKKISGEVRRKSIIHHLNTSTSPLKGSSLAEMMGVSRQIIVGDITLLKAQGAPIIATSQGYLYFHPNNESSLFEKQIASDHTPEQSLDELYTLVDAGVTVKDVTVEHPVYGQITASIMVSNRLEVDAFIEKVKNSGAGFLSELTGGVHLHTITAPKEEFINIAINNLKQKGYLAAE